VAKAKKQHFELTPANNLRLDEYIKRYNSDSDRITPKIKIADVVNLALDRWFSAQKAGLDAKESE
jgi:hypothetical protein